jgi:hypothetical protein
MDALSRVSAQVLDSALPSLPLYLLQATAVIGMIGVLLIATRRAGHAIEGRRLYVGVALGLIYLFNSWFVARYTQGVVKLHLGFDILLVSGLLGGWRGGWPAWPPPCWPATSSSAPSSSCLPASRPRCRWWPASGCAGACTRACSTNSRHA